MGDGVEEGGTAVAPVPETRGRGEVLEVSVFLFLILPSLVLSLFVVRGGGAGFTFTAVSVILRDLALVSLILYFLWRNREPLSRVGWSSRRVLADIGLGIILFPGVFFLVGAVEKAFQSAGLTLPENPRPSFLEATGAAQLLLASLLVVVVALSEETIFRGYLILRFAAITGSPALAAIISSLVFSLGHGYEGSAGMATVGVMGLILAAIYVWRGSLTAPMTIHFLQDFLGVVLVPLLGGEKGG